MPLFKNFRRQAHAPTPEQVLRAQHALMRYGVFYKNEDGFVLDTSNLVAGDCNKLFKAAETLSLGPYWDSKKHLKLFIESGDAQEVLQDSARAVLETSTPGQLWFEHRHRTSLRGYDTFALHMFKDKRPTKAFVQKIHNALETLGLQYEYYPDAYQQARKRNQLFLIVYDTPEFRQIINKPQPEPSSSPKWPVNGF